MSKVQKIIDHAEQHCKAHGARLTDKRKQVLSGLLQSKKALSAYELIDYCKENYVLFEEPIIGITNYLK